MQIQRFFTIIALTLMTTFLLQCTSSTTEDSENPHKHAADKATEEDSTKGSASTTKTSEELIYPQEKHFKNMRQLTFGGDNAEAYFSFDDSKLVLQVTNPEKGIECDQIFYAPIPQTAAENFDTKLVSTGKGRTTCSYFYPGDSTIVYASTHQAGEACPPKPDSEKIKAYVWPLYPTFEIYKADLQGNIIKKLTENGSYDAEATISPDGKTMVFTSTRNGDIDLYTMNLDGKNVKQVTNDLGYDGGAFFSPDSKKLIFRASRPKTPEDIKKYKDFLSQNLVAPTNMELYICNVDGSELKQITELGNANWAPYMHPSGEKVIFASNHKSKRGFPFNLYMVNIDGTGLEQITFDDQFDSFPMFSYDGKKIVFSSNRNNGGTRDTNVFIADWVE
ncbi:MAG: hypothetical protein AB8B69_11230 [Chitinophagales bacterium]